MANPIENRRKHRRFPSSTDGILLTVPVEPVDESYGGIGMILPLGWNIAEGTMIHVDYNGAPMLGRVCHQRSSADGRIQVGLAWAPFDSVDSEDGIELAPLESPKSIR